MKWLHLFIDFSLLLIAVPVRSQSVAINTDGSTAHASAMLEIKSSTKGLLIPRLTKTERNAIGSPATGLMIFQTGPDSIGFHYYNGSSWSWITSSSNGNDWKLTGNSGTDTSVNFIGTTDNMPLRFKISNLFAGQISGSNTNLGSSSGKSITSGFYNTGIGVNSMYYLSTGNNNTAVGKEALLLLTAGSYNVALGAQALFSTTGSYNTGVGYEALRLATTSNYNTALGYWAMRSNTTGHNNVAVGSNAFYSNLTGNYLTGIGDSTEVLAASLSNATAIGAKAAINCSNCMVLGGVKGVNNATSATNVGIGTTDPDAMFHVKGGAVLFDSSIGTTPISGAGTRLMWIPAKGAFRAGYTGPTEWDDVNIGYRSVAMGFRTAAPGDNATAFGSYCYADGDYSFAIGNQSTASGNNSIAMGTSSAYGTGSTAIGTGPVAYGSNATAFGFYTRSKSFAGCVVGSFNDSTNAASSTSQNGLNRIFEIGNGTADNARSNAITVLFNGNVGIGTTTPGVMLDVNGTTTTNGLQVGNGTTFSKMQSGSVTVGPSASSELVYTLTFPVAFTSSTPKIFVTARNEPSTSYSDAFSVSIKSISAASVTFNIQRTDTNGAWAQQLRLDWFGVE